MNFKEYTEKAMSTRLESCENSSYMLLNLVGEVGEFAGKIAKAIRKKDLMIEGNRLIPRYIDADELFGLNEQLKLEAGDIMWQLFGLIDTLGWDAEEIANMNLQKLAARKKENTIIGSGDGVTKEERKEK